MPSDRLDGVALVTGGGRGIGASIARELADAGMRVAVTGRTRRAGRGGRERDRRARARRRRLAAPRTSSGGSSGRSASSGRSTSSSRTPASAISDGATLGDRAGGVVARARGERARRLPLLPRRHPAACSSAGAGGSSSRAAAPRTFPGRSRHGVLGEQGGRLPLRRDAREPSSSGRIPVFFFSPGLVRTE